MSIANISAPELIRYRTWQERRRQGIGASEAAAVCGRSPWTTPLGIYMEKVHPGLVLSTSQPMRWGQLLEDVIATAYEDETGRQLDQDGDYLYDPASIRQHADYPWMLASLDRYAADRIVELKTASAFTARDWGELGTDQVPETYIFQVQHQMAVSGHSLADIAVLIGGQDFRIYSVPRNDALIARLVEIEAEFWHLVERRESPPPDWANRQTPALVEALYPPRDGVIDLESKEDVAADVYEQLGQDIKDREAAREVVRAKLIESMGTAVEGKLPSGRTIKRATVHRKEYTVKESEYTTFKICSRKHRP